MAGRLIDHQATIDALFDAQALAAFIDTLPLPPAEKSRLKALTPEGYTGLAAKLAREI